VSPALLCAGASLVFGQRFKNRHHRWQALIIEISSFADISSSRAGVIGCSRRSFAICVVRVWVMVVRFTRDYFAKVRVDVVKDPPMRPSGAAS
jgi:hypothetical protein